jgi:PPOX class probable F420-dependent enzyme
MTEGPLPDADSDFGRRVRDRLRDENVIWLTTTQADGTPQPNPVWFVWEDPDTLLVYNQPDAKRLMHVQSRPRCSLHFNADASGNDVAVFVGTATRDDGRPPPHEHPTYRVKYAEGMIRVSGTAEQFSVEWGVPLVIHVDRIRGYP